MESTKTLICRKPTDPCALGAVSREAGQHCYGGKTDGARCTFLREEETPTLETVEQLREALAALEHEQWVHWTDYMLRVLAPLFGAEEMLHHPQATAAVDRWRQQIATPYAGLTPAEQDSDRAWADKVLEHLRHANAITERTEEATLTLAETQEAELELLRARVAEFEEELSEANTVIDNLRKVSLMSPSQVCLEYHIQACHNCDSLDCGDNTSEAKKARDDALTVASDCRDAWERAERERDEAQDSLEQERVKAAGVLTALDGHHPDPPVERGDYGWSPAYDRALEVRQELEEARDEARDWMEAAVNEQNIHNEVRQALEQRDNDYYDLFCRWKALEHAHRPAEAWRQTAERHAAREREALAQVEGLCATLSAGKEAYKELEAQVERARREASESAFARGRETERAIMRREVEQARREEREAVVAWLRSLWGTLTGPIQRALCWRCVEAIESGAHLQPSPARDVPTMPVDEEADELVDAAARAYQATAGEHGPLVGLEEE